MDLFNVVSKLAHAAADINIALWAAPLLSN
jgi:hypothetical protein